MGNVSSRPDEPVALYLRDQNRLSISSLVISSPRKRTSVNIVPNSFPATRLSASRPLGDNSPVEYIQDPEVPSSAGGPAFLLKLANDDELIFTFTFVIRRPQQLPATSTEGVETNGAADTHINGLTYVYTSTQREAENLVTREFQADPNFHKNSNVELVGDYSTDGSPSVTFEWSWRWKPPKNTEDKGGGWRNTCSFMEYDQRAHRLDTLASFSFWVSNVSPYLNQPNSPSLPFLLTHAPKLRVVSAQSIDSRTSALEPLEPPLSPMVSIHNLGDTLSPGVGQTTAPREPIKVDVSCPRPGEDVTVSDDGPVFRATMKALELKTGNMRLQMKKVIKKAETAQNAQVEASDAFNSFIEALKEASSTNANAVQPAIEHYFDKIAREILAYERQNASNLQRMIIDPLNKLYTFDIKQAENKKRDFEEESKEYYSYVGRYLGQKQDAKTKKLAESDNKYQNKRRNFELKRFDYSTFMQDLSGGRKEQEVLSHLTRFADAQARCFLNVSKKVESLLPELEALSGEVQQADKEYQYQRREREEKRRQLEKSNLSYVEPDPVISVTAPAQPPAQAATNNQTYSEPDLGRADSTGSGLNIGAPPTPAVAGDMARSPGSLSHHASVGSPSQNSKFRGIRDLEERDLTRINSSEKNGTQRKEGLLWALNRPGSHVDPRSLNKQAWHKFWIVLDQGKLSEYSNWKQQLDLHMEPIDLRMASVREARNAERRFCFEVITPAFRRTYQATTEDEMNSWISAINNALQSAVEGRAYPRDKPAASPRDSSFDKKDIGSILTGKSPSVGHNHHHYHYGGSAASGMPTRRITVGSRPGTARSVSLEDTQPDKLLRALREHDQGNSYCADCGSTSKVEWVSINLAIILCIECSGIHRSLGTHISKIRSLTLDITSFTPDIIELLMLVGNRLANMVWEQRLDPAHKPAPQATREQRLRFITAKYVERAYVEPISATLSRYPTADETLVAGIKKNEIKEVIYALALQANPNVIDRSRGNHAVFLALAAADPVTPSQSPPSTNPASTVTTGRVIPFPVAELLLQNGAEIPPTMPTFPLSRSALAYVEHKRGRSAAINALSSGGGSSVLSESGGGGATSSLSSSLSNSSSSAATDRLQRDKEARLQKRVSAGGRLAKSPIPEGR